MLGRDIAVAIVRDDEFAEVGKREAGTFPTGAKQFPTLFMTPIPPFPCTQAVSNWRKMDRTTLTCDEFLALIKSEPKSCSISDVGLAHKHFTECQVCHDVLGLNESGMKWRNAWDELHTDSKKDIGTFVAVAVCILLGIFLFWALAR